MPQYDPQRSRSRQRKADDEGPAPVDALLGPEPAAPESVTAETETPAETKTPAASVNGRAPGAVSPAIDSPPVRLAADEPTGSRSGAKPLAVAAAVAAVLLAVWWVLRRRRGPDGDATG